MASEGGPQADAALAHVRTQTPEARHEDKVDLDTKNADRVDLFILYNETCF